MDIVIENFSKHYGTQKAVDNISFEVKTGEVLGFLGPNGAGKTTTMKAITAYLQPTNGSIKVGNYSVRDEAEMIKKHIGYLPEQNPLYKDMPVIDYLRFVAELQQIPSAKINSRIIEMVQICGLEGEKHKKIEELSKGYQQRVGLAQALIHEPEVLILDEPTTGLDPNQIVEIRELIRNIGKERTVILSSHILAEVEATCDRILIISKGKIVGNGTAAELRKQASGNDIVRVTIEDADREQIFEALQDLPSVKIVEPAEKARNTFEVHSETDSSIARGIFNMCVEKGWVITEMNKIETRLEDIFRELTM